MRSSKVTLACIPAVPPSRPPQSKRKFERDCREAEKAMLAAEKLDQDLNATKADVEKVGTLLSPWLESL